MIHAISQIVIETVSVLNMHDALLEKNTNSLVEPQNTYKYIQKKFF